MGFANQTMSNLVISSSIEEMKHTSLHYLPSSSGSRTFLRAYAIFRLLIFLTLLRTSHMNIQICSKTKQIILSVVMIRRFSSVLLLVQFSFIE